MNFKNIIPLVAALCFSMSVAFAQTTPSSNNDALFENTSRDRLIIELGHANLNNKPANMELKWFSRAINVYLMYDIAISRNENFSFAPGVGIGTNVYSHNIGFGLTDDGTTFFEALDSVAYTRNNLSTNFFDIPLEFRFRTNPDKFGRRFKVAAGFKGGYLFNGHTKWVGNERSNVPLENYKNLSIPNLNNIRYGYTLRIGYSNFNIIGFYSAAPLFKIGKSTVEKGVRPFYIGFSFNSL